MAKGKKTGGRVAGTPNKVGGAIRELAQQYGPASIERLAKLSGILPDEPGSESETTQVAAMKELLDRGYGKAHQSISGPDNGAIEMIITGVRRVIEDGNAA